MHKDIITTLRVHAYILILAIAISILVYVAIDNYEISISIFIIIQSINIAGSIKSSLMLKRTAKDYESNKMKKGHDKRDTIA